MTHFAMGSRQNLAANLRRHSNSGILSHEDGLNEATSCPGIHFYRRLRDSIVPDAIFTANHVALFRGQPDDNEN